MGTGHNFQLSSLGNELFELEKERKKVVKLKQTSFILSIILFLVAVLVVSVTKDLHKYALHILAILPMFLYLAIIKPVLKKQSNFKLKYRRLIVEKLMKKIAPDIVYDPEGFVTDGHFMASDIYEAYTEDYRGQNYFKLELPNHSIEFSEVTAFDAEGGNNKGKKLVFSGLFYLVKWNKLLKGRTIITTDKGSGAFGKVTNYFESKKFDGYKRLAIDNKEFEELFQVYSNDHSESSSILNQNFIETLIALRKIYPNGVQISIVPKGMYILINTSKRYFDPKTKVQVDNEEQIQRYYADLQELLEVVHSIQPFIQSIP